MQAVSVSTCGGKRTTGLVAQGTASLPLVSVITAVFNGRPYIQNCMESVLKQDYPNIEHLVLDGGSTDGTLDVLRQYDDRIAFWKSEPDKGVYDAWNKALAQARGEWICFLGADDEFLPGAIRAYMNLAAQHPQAEYLNSREQWLHADGYQRTRGKPWTWPAILRQMCMAHVGSMHRRSLFERLGVYDLSFGTAADYELLLRARDSLRTAYMPAVTVIMRAGGMSEARASRVDATRAKIVTGGQNAILANLELGIANAKFLLRPLRHTLGRILKR